MEKETSGLSSATTVKEITLALETCNKFLEMPHLPVSRSPRKQNRFCSLASHMLIGSFLFVRLLHQIIKHGLKNLIILRWYPEVWYICWNSFSRANLRTKDIFAYSSVFFSSPLIKIPVGFVEIRLPSLDFNLTHILEFWTLNISGLSTRNGCRCVDTGLGLSWVSTQRFRTQLRPCPKWCFKSFKSAL